MAASVGALMAVISRHTQRQMLRLLEELQRRVQKLEGNRKLDHDRLTALLRNGRADL
jgi:hypothetical protein